MQQPSGSPSVTIKNHSPSKWKMATLFLLAVVALQTLLIINFYNQGSSLRTNHQSLTFQYTDLQDQYDSMQDDHSQLQTRYNDLQSNFDSYENGYAELAAQTNLHSKHPSENEKQLVTPNDPGVVSTMLQATGGWSNPSDWNEYWSDAQKLYNWVVTNIEYAKDPTYPSLPPSPEWSLGWSQDNWQFPSETLRTKQGDCEDQALLLQSMILAYNSQKYSVYSIVITTHVATFFPVVDDQMCILDPAGNYLTNSGWPSYSITQKDIRQETYNWLNHIGGNEHVDRVFTDTEWKSFSGTEDFITWTYNR